MTSEERKAKVYDGDVKDINPDVEEDAEVHLEELLEEDKEFKELWESEGPKRSIGTQVLRRRMELGWSQRELASKVNTSQNRIHLIESGEANPTVESLYRLAKVLGLELEISFSDPESRKLGSEAESKASDSVQEALVAARQLSRTIAETSERTERAKQLWHEVLDGATKARTWNAQVGRYLLKANENYSLSLFHSLFQHAAEQMERSEASREYDRYYTFVCRRQENALETLWRKQEQAFELINKHFVDGDWKSVMERVNALYESQEEYGDQVYAVPFKESIGSWVTVDEEQSEAYQALMAESLEAYRDFLAAPLAYYAEASSTGVSD